MLLTLDTKLSGVSVCVEACGIHGHLTLVGPGGVMVNLE